MVVEVIFSSLLFFVFFGTDFVFFRGFFISVPQARYPITSAGSIGG
jgi:hypothetical protein